jgi:hypothetical protein
MRSVFEWVFAILSLLAAIAAIGMIVGVFAGSVAGVALFVFEALR